MAKKQKEISMTVAEIRRVYGKDEAKAIAMAQAAPESTNEEIGVKPGPVIARGFAQFHEHINKAGRPKAASRKAKISIRLPETAVASLRQIDGYSTILSEYIMVGIKSGAIKLPHNTAVTS